MKAFRCTAAIAAALLACVAHGAEPAKPSRLALVIETAAGKLRAVKVTREVRWRERGRDYGGLNVWNYWYSPEAKRLVRGENTNTTGNGKLSLHELWELESFSVR